MVQSVGKCISNWLESIPIVAVVLNVELKLVCVFGSSFSGVIFTINRQFSHLWLIINLCNTSLDWDLFETALGQCTCPYVPPPGTVYLSLCPMPCLGRSTCAHVPLHCFDVVWV